MSKFQMLRVEERSIVEYEEEFSRSQHENYHQHKQLCAAFNPEVRLHRADIQQLLVQQEWSPSLDQEEPEPRLIKEEQKEFGTSEEGEQLHGVEEAEITKFTVKSEDDEREVQSTQLHQNQTEENTEAELPPSSSVVQIKTEADGEDCGGPDSTENFDPVFPADIQQLFVQQEWSPSLDKKEPEPPLIKEEQREFGTSEEGEQLHGVEEADITKVTVKSEDDEREVQSTQLHQNQTEENTEAELLPSSSVVQIKTEADGEDCGGPDTTRNFDPALPADIQQVLVHQKWSLSLDQDEPEPPHIKEEQEALWISQEGEQLHDLKESVKSEDDEAKVQSSQLYESQSDENTEAEPPSSISTERIKTEADGENCGGQAKNVDPSSNFQSVSNDKASDSSETASQYSEDDWKETRQLRSGFHNQKNYEVHVNNIKCNSGKKSFCCSECGATFKFKGNLEKHMSTHTRRFRYSISENSTQSAHLKNHLKIQVKQFSCSNCNKTFSKNGKLKRHMRIHTGEKPFSCSVCGKTFSQKAILNRHMPIHTVEKAFSCSVCGKTFTQNGMLKRHMRIHTEEKPFSCSVCGKTFTQNGILKKHMRIHTGDKPFSCSVCGKTFTRNGMLKRHMRIHTGEKPFSCSVCGKNFTQRVAVKHHMRIHTGERPFSCSVCGKTFTRNGILKKHMRIHTGEKPFSCSVCGKTFTQNGILKKHMRIHTGERPFSCSVCGKTFRRNEGVKQHMIFHTGEKPYSCSVCGKNFTERVAVKLHMRIHTGERPFSCSVCGKTFTRNGILKKHMIIHTGDKPFSCSVCGKTFRRNQGLKQHMICHTGERPFSCSVCGETFTRNGTLKRHMRIHTGGKLL